MEYKERHGQEGSAKKNKQGKSPDLYHPVHRGEEVKFEPPIHRVKPGDNPVKIELMGQEKKEGESREKKSAEQIRQKLVEMVKELENLWTDFEIKASRLETAGVTGFYARDLVGYTAKYGRRGGAVGEYLKEMDPLVIKGEYNPERVAEIDKKFIRDEELPIIQRLTDSLMDWDPQSGKKIDFEPTSRFLAFMRESLKKIDTTLHGGPGIGEIARKHGATDAARFPGTSELMDGLWADYKKISDTIIAIRQLTNPIDTNR